jgi:hypothetical protein
MKKIPTNKLSVGISRKKTGGRPRDRGEDKVIMNNLGKW